MYLIDESYFTGLLQNPNTGQSLDIPNGGLSFVTYIDKYSRQLLQNALGNVLFDDFDSNIENGILKEDVEEKWKNLVNGLSYEKDDKFYKWKGLIYQEGAFKGSVLAYYTSANWHRENVSRTSALGEVVGKSKNTTHVNNTHKVVQIWNEYIEMYQGNITDEDSYQFSIKNGVPFHDYYKGRESDYVPLLTFLQHNDSDYPNALLRIEKEGYYNTLGL